MKKYIINDDTRYVLYYCVNYDKKSLVLELVYNEKL